MSAPEPLRGGVPDVRVVGAALRGERHGHSTQGVDGASVNGRGVAVPNPVSYSSQPWAASLASHPPAPAAPRLCIPLRRCTLSS